VATTGRAVDGIHQFVLEKRHHPGCLLDCPRGAFVLAFHSAVRLTVNVRANHVRVRGVPVSQLGEQFSARHDRLGLESLHRRVVVDLGRHQTLQQRLGVHRVDRCKPAIAIGCENDRSPVGSVLALALVVQLMEGHVPDPDELSG